MEDLVQKVEEYVSNLLLNRLSHNYVYHNLVHTQTVVEKTKEIAEAEGINEEFQEILIIAAWFHDSGFTVNNVEHEQEALPIIREFLGKHNYDEEKIQLVCDLVLATDIRVEPKNHLEEIIRDADSSHVGSLEFTERSALLRTEWETFAGKPLEEMEWYDININFLSSVHRYYTKYALDEWGVRRAKNLARVLRKKKKLEKQAVKLKQKKALKNQKKKEKLPERGIETMFRVTMRNHITLSDIADRKANILLSVNAIIVSLALSSLLPKLDNPSNSHLIIPTLIFILFTVASMILSVLATRPNVTQGKFTKQDVIDRKVNLIFFGNFHKMSLKDFEWAMGEMMQDKNYLYSSLKKDLYFLGLVLDKKYKILRITYTVFMVGIIISVLAFVLAFSFSASGRGIMLF